MAGHRKGKMGPGRYPRNASIAFIKLIESAMDNARQHHEDIDAEDMIINHYQVNLEIFLEHYGEDEDEELF